MTALLADGLSAGEAARSLRDARAGTARRTGDDGRPAGACELADALAALDEARANAILDRAVAALSLDALLSRRPTGGDARDRRALGARRDRDRRGALRQQPRPRAAWWPSPAAGEPVTEHSPCSPARRASTTTSGLIAFGLALRARGWRIAYLGQDTPIETAAATAERLGARLIVVAALDPEALRPHVAELRGLAGLAALRLGGPGARRRWRRSWARRRFRPTRWRPRAGRRRSRRRGRDEPAADRVPGGGPQRRRRHPAADERRRRPGDRRRGAGPRASPATPGSRSPTARRRPGSGSGWRAPGLRTGSELPTLIVDAGDGRLLGAVGLHNLDPESGRCSAGYWVAAAERRRGVARRGAHAALPLRVRRARRAAGRALDRARERGRRCASPRPRGSRARACCARSCTSAASRRDMLMYSLLPSDLALSLESRQPALPSTVSEHGCASFAQPRDPPFARSPS